MIFSENRSPLFGIMQAKKVATLNMGTGKGQCEVGNANVREMLI